MIKKSKSGPISHSVYIPPTVHDDLT